MLATLRKPSNRNAIHRAVLYKGGILEVVAGSSGLPTGLSEHHIISEWMERCKHFVGFITQLNKFTPRRVLTLG